eukprot:366217-Chlamydomonas_euryale.AAC.10
MKPHEDYTEHPPGTHRLQGDSRSRERQQRHARRKENERDQEGPARGSALTAEKCAGARTA